MADREQFLKLANEAYVKAAHAQTNGERWVHLDNAAAYERAAERVSANG